MNAAQGAFHADLDDGRFGRAGQEVADQPQPDARDQPAWLKREQDPEGDDRVADHLPDSRRVARRRVAVAADTPQDRAQDPAAVHRKSGNQVEGAKGHVDESEPAEECAKLLLLDAKIDQVQQAADEQAADGPGAGDQRLVLRPTRLALHGGRSAEDEERDRGGAHAKASRHQRVGQLVGEYRSKEEERGRGRNQPVETGAPAWVVVRELDLSERIGDQESDHQPGEVQLHGDARDLQDPKRGTHAASVAEGAFRTDDGGLG